MNNQVFDTARTVLCWGAGPVIGVAGSGKGCAVPCTTVPTPVVIDQRFVPVSFQSVKTATSGNANCALTTDGRPFCWGGGANQYISARPAQASTTFTRLTDAGDACALTADGAVHCLAIHFSGPADAAFAFQPYPIGAPMATVTIFDLGASCGLGLDGVGYCWGPASTRGDGVIDGPNVPATSPVRIFGQP